MLIKLAQEGLPTFFSLKLFKLMEKMTENNFNTSHLNAVLLF